MYRFVLMNSTRIGLFNVFVSLFNVEEGGDSVKEYLCQGAHTTSCNVPPLHPHIYFGYLYIVGGALKEVK